MLKTFDRYMIKLLFKTILFITIVIVSILLLLGLMAEAKNIGEGDYYFLQSIYYILLRLPNELYRFSPLLLLLSLLIGLSILSASLELTIMRAAGYSLRNIIRNLILVALIFIIVMFSLGELLGPRASFEAEVFRENAKNAGQAMVTASGIWLHIDNNFIHIERVVAKNKLRGITRYEVNSNRKLIAAYYADTLFYQKEGWKLKNVLKTSFYDAHTNSEFFKELDWELPLNSNLFQIGFDNPNEMSLSKLLHIATYLSQNGLENRAFTFQFWRRLTLPFSSLVMVFLSIPFVLNATERTANIGGRVFIGLIIGFLFFILNAILSQLSIVYQFPTFVAAMAPPVLFALISMILFKKLVR